jgi:xanthine dehydrogenase YagT iron-sulfur-binding subunit
VIEVALSVNGTQHRVAVGELTTLADLLRGPVGLHGTKIACGEGTCGACTVLVDGAPMLSCILLAGQADGAEVRTVEGLGVEGALSELQQAFIDEDAFQCGYCTPGQIVSGVGCIQEGHTGSPEEVREWMSGNICRCGCYVKIVRAVEQTAGRK